MLENAGFSQEQAETSITILAEVMEDKLATKQDLTDVQKDLRGEMAELRKEMTDFRTYVDHRFDQLESKLTIRMGTMLAASIAILTAIQKLA